MITLTQAKSLSYRQIIHGNITKNADGTCARYRVNGLVHTWKRNPSRVLVPLKHGLYDCGRLTEHNLHLFHLPADCPHDHPADPVAKTLQLSLILTPNTRT